MITDIICLLLAFYILFWILKNLFKILKYIIEHISLFISDCKRKKYAEARSKELTDDFSDMSDNKTPYEN